MGGPFKNALCNLPPPGAGGWMNTTARRGCIRRKRHTGKHRNRILEWSHGDHEAHPRTDCTGKAAPRTERAP